MLFLLAFPQYFRYTFNIYYSGIVAEFSADFGHIQKGMTILAAGNTKASELSPVLKVLRVIYWIIFAISLAIVILFFIFKLFITPPDVGGEQIIVPGQVTIDVPGQTGDNTQEDDPGVQESQSPQQLVLNRREGVYTCLLTGTDDGNGNADTIMLGVFDTVNFTASLISIPRDTLVQVNGKNWKINATYSLGGMDLMCSTVSEMLAVPVDFYVSVDLQAFSKIVDEVGGVWFTVPQDMEYNDPTQDLYIDLKAGYQLLDGEHALQLMRFREGYASKDIGRTQTQRAFLVAMVKQAISLSNVDKVTSLIQILNQYVDSNMPLNNMIYFATKAIGMDLNANLSAAVLPSDWIYPVLELRDEEVLALVNSLGIYEEEVPLEALRIHHNN